MRLFLYTLLHRNKIYCPIFRYRFNKWIWFWSWEGL